MEERYEKQLREISVKTGRGFVVGLAKLYLLSTLSESNNV
jgi:hypothetical protein